MGQLVKKDLYELDYLKLNIKVRRETSLKNIHLDIRSYDTKKLK